LMLLLLVSDCAILSPSWWRCLELAAECYPDRLVEVCLELAAECYPDRLSLAPRLRRWRCDVKNRLLLVATRAMVCCTVR